MDRKLLTTPHAFEWLTDNVMAINPDAVGRALPPPPRGTGDPKAWFDYDDDDTPSYTRSATGGIAIVDIQGPLQQRACWYDGYDAIKSRFGQALIDPAVRAVALRMSTPGGVCSGCFEAVAAMRRMADDAQKPVYAFADESAFSAGYALATVASKIFVPRSGGVGSVGVVTCLYDVSKANEMAGVTVNVITSGAQKADGDPNVPMSADVIARFHARTMQLANQFAELVGASRNMTVDKVLALQAGCFYGDDAVKAGLADGVVSWDDFIKMLDAAGATAARPTSLRTSRAAASGAEQKERKTMLAAILAATFGLAATASEDDLARAVHDHKVKADKTSSELASVLSATGAKTADEAVGTVTALRATSEQFTAQKATIAKLEGTIEGHERNTLIAANATKLTPAMMPWATSVSIETLRSFLAVAPENALLKGAQMPAANGVGTVAATQPASSEANSDQGVTELAGKKWEELSYNDKATLATAFPEVYKATKAAYEARTGNKVGALKTNPAR